MINMTKSWQWLDCNVTNNESDLTSLCILPLIEWPVAVEIKKWHSIFTTYRIWCNILVMYEFCFTFLFGGFQLWTYSFIAQETNTLSGLVDVVVTVVFYKYLECSCVDKDSWSEIWTVVCMKVFTTSGCEMGIDGGLSLDRGLSHPITCLEGD